MKKLKLAINNVEPLLIMGLVSTLNDIKLAWHLNQLLKINLSRFENEEFGLKLGATEYSIFQFTDNTRCYTLVNNKVKDFYAFDDYKKMDYLFIVTGEIDSQLVQNITSILKKDPQIPASIEIPFLKIKRKELFGYF